MFCDFGRAGTRFEIRGIQFNGGDVVRGLLSGTWCGVHIIDVLAFGFQEEFFL